MKEIYCWSGGKDSTASIILSHIMGRKPGTIIFSEVMFDKDISGELPEQVEFIREKAIPTFESWGFSVEILHAKETYLDLFYKVNQGKKHPERKGKYYGFPMAGKCIINDRCKMNPIRQYMKSIQGDYTEYVGIAIDEPKRLARLNGTTKVSLLEKYGHTEQMAYDLCNEFDLLSPVYEFSKRGGCWFCPNARDCELRHTRNNHPNLWNKLLQLENEPNLIGNMWNILQQKSIHDKEEQFRLEEAQMTIFDFIKEE